MAKNSNYVRLVEQALGMSRRQFIQDYIEKGETRQSAADRAGIHYKTLERWEEEEGLVVERVARFRDDQSELLASK